MEPTSAREVIPCFDEPEFKAKFDVTIRHRSDMTALSNGIELRSTDLGGSESGWKETVFKTTPRMSTYLFAVAVTHFVSMNKTTVGGTLIRVWSKPQDIKYAQYALDSAVNQTAFFEIYFNYTYPLEKQDMVAVPRFISEAMENWGLIMYHERAMIFNPTKDSPLKKEKIAMVVAHEIAHQWLGNLVTPMWWDDLWLNEGFAVYSQYIGVNYCEPQWKMKDEMSLTHNHMVALMLDSRADTHPIRQEVNTPDEIFSLFDAITYKKGATIVRMLVDMLGEKVFQTGLKDYIRMHAYSNTNTDDLWESLTRADVNHGGKDVKTIMDTWTLQEGYPLVTFHRENNTVVRGSQKMFLIDDGATAEFGDKRHTWEILISHTHESERNYMTPRKDWIHKENTGKLTLSDGVQQSDWYLVNIGRHGFYRVNYDVTNWKRLSDQLFRDHEVIPLQNRFQLLDDAVSLVFQLDDELNVNILLDMTSYLHQEFEYLPWISASLIASRLRDILKLQPAYGLLQKYWQQKISPIYKYLGWFGNDTDVEQVYPEILTFRRITIESACFFGVEDCVEEAQNLYAQFMADPASNPISQNSGLRPFAYCLGIMHGGQREWEFGLEQYLSLSARDREEDEDWLYSLCCTAQPWLLNRLLRDAYDGNYKPKAFNTAIRHMSEYDVGLTVAWEYVQQDWDDMWNTSSYYYRSFPRFSSRGTDVTFSTLIKDIASKMSTKVQLKQLIDFGKSRNFGSFVEKVYRRSIQTVKKNLRTRDKFSAPIKRWLSKHT